MCDAHVACERRGSINEGGRGFARFVQDGANKSTPIDSCDFMEAAIIESDCRAESQKNRWMKSGWATTFFCGCDTTLGKNDKT